MFTFSIPGDRIRAPMTSLAEKKKTTKELTKIAVGAWKCGVWMHTPPQH